MKDSAGVSLLVYGTKQKILFVLCGGGWGVAMAIQVSLGILLNEISEEWGVTYIEQSLIPICTMLGVFFGSYFWGIFADKYGRKHAFRSVLFFIFFGIAIGICSPNIWMLAPCYVITGFGIGGSFTVDGNVFLEYCPHEKQYLLTGISILSAFGASVPPGIAWLYSSLDLPYQWRFVQGTLGLIALLLIVPRFWIEETPTFLISKRKATAVYNLIKDINPDEDEELLRSRILEASPTISAEENGLGKQLKILLRKPLKKYTILYFFIWFGTAFTFNGLGNFLPVLLKRAGFGQTDSDIYRTMLFQQLAGIPGVISAMYMVKGRLGRKWTLAISLYSAVGLIYGFLLTNYYSLLVCSLWYYFFQNIFYAVMFCISPETFPSQVRNTAVGVFGSGNTLASMVAPVLAGLILDFTSNNLIFTVVFSFSTLTAAICSTWVIETRGFNPQSFEI